MYYLSVFVYLNNLEIYEECVCWINSLFCFVSNVIGEYSIEN